MIFRRLVSTAASFRLPPNIRQILETTTAKPSDQPSIISGWVRSIRKQKNVTFAVITDGSGAQDLQAVLMRPKGPDEGVLRKLTNGCAVRLTGQLVQSPGKGQSHELLVDERTGGGIEILGECDPEMYPIQKQSLSTEHLRENIHLRARTAHTGAMIRLRDHLSHGINSWFEDQGFCYVHTPILTSSDAEGAGESFRIAPIKGEDQISDEFFSRPAYMTVSHQLHLEAVASALSRVYTLSPCFRAERSQTGRHLAEFWMLEAEWGFCEGANSIEQVCSMVEGCLRSVYGKVTSNRQSQADMDVLWSQNDERKRKIMTDAFSAQKGWTRMTYTQAIKELAAFEGWSRKKFEFKPEWGKTLQSEHERWLADVLVGGPVFVTDYPASLKPFYMRENNDEERTVACVDLLIPQIGELVGGSVREERGAELKKKMESGPGMEWYSELRRYGGAPHAGFGMGFERLVGWLGGIDNVRECVAVPRWCGRLLL